MSSPERILPDALHQVCEQQSLAVAKVNSKCLASLGEEHFMFPLPICNKLPHRGDTAYLRMRGCRISKLALVNPMVHYCAVALRPTPMTGGIPVRRGVAAWAP
ncbi:hypothetical protein AVEN_183520-1 [Araneus ventricosus]|uniref:Uncharacterized protein n=1 Tax=Araneus ventricosus TaxID=182803 RepID=A0A4Y2LR72_ARAVE|nr:hypothetical protein AVEN_236364-1 [Araneus ventricosus]GBN17202.1 hypothetical protein AVEN_56713-1 [Araneus ventricosus]GBN17271.1 hypothetical protein AVEN_112064-1 [Araneus ventricosus]GBN17341.1 hypothetical protein AVEN_183520-1 [Araneus ventricosus]